MFLLFFNLYVALFRGQYSAYSWADIINWTKNSINTIGAWITSIFSGVTTPYETLGTIMDNINGLPGIIYLICLILTLITSIGIVLMAVKGVKKAFGIFFMGIR